MYEVGVVLDVNSKPVFWHRPTEATVGSLPDSRPLWDALWEQHQMGMLQGFAHTHPGHGVPGPSTTDVSTFQAIEAGLGRRLTWWIATVDRVIVLHWRDCAGTYVATLVEDVPVKAWLLPLRQRSGMYY